MNPPQVPLIDVFVSCSIRPEDAPFVNFVERILRSHGYNPMGTIGRHYFSPENPVTPTIPNIKKAKFVVAIATKRFETTDVHNNNVSNTPSIFVHSEIAIAHTCSKPVVVFVKEGTDAGNFVSSVTQHITLDGTMNDYLSKMLQIKSLLNNALRMANSRKKISFGEGLAWFTAGAFVVKLFSSIGSNSVVCECICPVEQSEIEDSDNS